MAEPTMKFELPADLSLLKVPELEALQAEAQTEFDALYAIEDISPQLVEYQIRVTRASERIAAELAGRAVAAAQTAESEQKILRDQRDLLQLRMHPEGPPAEGTVELQAAAAFDPAAIAQAAAEGAVAGMVAVLGDRFPRSTGGTYIEVRERATASLAAAAQHQPASQRPAVPVPGATVIMAGSDQQLQTEADVAKAFEDIAGTMYATRNGFGNPTKVARVRKTFEHVLDDRTPVGDVMRIMDKLRTVDNQQALLAGGGWCAPSLPLYNFFNIACQDGLVDLPTVGIQRGGLQIPVSPSLADAVYTVGGVAGQGFPGFAGPANMSVTSMPFVWSETDDIATVTGNPNKPTMRVPCPTYNNNRLEVYGIQLTAGNLTNDAFPEATQNTIRLLNAAWSHAQNARIIAQMAALSTVAVTISGGANRPAYNQVLSGLDLVATDYRAKFGMCDEDVLEVVAPYWVADVIVADLAWRTNVELLSVAEEQITGYFRDRGLRVQWVNDWQVRSAGLFGQPSAQLAAWPTQAQFMVYAAGTFLKGNGLTLDLGVIRDSVLNAENDYTAVFTEEAHMVAKPGHESRLVTVGFTVNGSAAASQTLGAYI